ncbi:hypothetical protein [Enterovirga rhinocerotis]|uniref:Nickel/cobalt transporter regulator n=1 Tax=Enterovirga rhinocerotis TaxID=1339210 RepID=A0A4R7BIM9_9HYPH|nr:hypothetical protein [Enterovirga rhinocerotis]TDR85180.1 hypothetical protein EV668_4724 [Enterovirga rhinocerotis]
MRTLLVSAAVAAAFLVQAMLAASPALADAPPAGYRGHARPAPAYHRPSRLGHAPVRRHHRRYAASGRGYAIGPSYGGLPPFYPGEGAAASHLQGAPVMMTLYREAYIGRGLIYNTPPQTSAPRGPVLSVRY